ncbi:hypothetical protein I79_026014 [Cricetulus griseus]|uniref:Uncharacterized protein n=1 Tax=Cricetulus griseus TaxID=10029 RepID=G3IPT6_CRIGR|nr:hypothetical protein I79_026014 [Cricetulus griseus]
MQMTTHLKSTVQMWRRSQRRTTPKWGSVSNKLLGHLPEGDEALCCPWGPVLLR